LFEHLETTDAVLINPCLGLRLPKIGERLPRNVLTPGEARRVLDAPDTQTLQGIRDKAILEVFYSTGIRLEELTRLSVLDVDYTNGFVRVTQGKGRKDRMVPMGSKACDYVREYLQKVRAQWSVASRDERALWLSARQPHQPIKAQVIEVLVRHYGQQAGLEKRVTPHVWRHSCATHLLANGSDVAYVQQLLGHRCLRTTQVYTRVSIADLTATHQKAHPRQSRRVRLPEKAATP
jgi:integrase/recombinase XerD